MPLLESVDVLNSLLSPQNDFFIFVPSTPKLAHSTHHDTPSIQPPFEPIEQVATPFTLERWVKISLADTLDVYISPFHEIE